ncbi:MAG: hypothetical protein JNK85_22615 [Verrucomicrobiales bacterium]|nr:hypothetical protein [Verrucomicrobiales bacterium]
MKQTRRSLLFILAALALGGVARAQTLNQSFELRPGWNAVWLEVDPPNRDPAVVFADLPIASVWTWSDRVSATDFIQNPGEAGWNRAQWLSFFPQTSPESPLSNLRAVLPQRAYLVRLAGSNAVNWAVSGRPILRTPEWAPDHYNLRGFSVDPAVPISFRAFFRSSPAHFDATRNQLEAIYRLSPDGAWNLVAPDASMRRGEAYWVYSRGPSDFVAPFHLELNAGDVVDFDATQRRVDMTIRNRHALTKSIRVQHLVTNPTYLVLMQSPLSGSTNTSKPLDTHTQLVNAATSHKLVLALDRAKLPASGPHPSQPDLHTSLLSVSDGEGTLFNVGARVLASSSPDFTGLWLGTASITNVVPVPESGDQTGTGAVPMPFPLRVLLHVDAGGQVTLLRDVTLLYTSTNVAAATTNSPTATVLSTRPTRLITDPAILATLSPLDLRAGRITGRRLTAPHFDFALGTGQLQLPLAGTMAVSNQVSGTLNLPPDLPTNPFLHRYHPDHGTNRAYAVTREVTLAFDAAVNAPPGEGDQALGGTYSETITGLHKRPLSTSGALALRRISEVGTLNAP